MIKELKVESLFGQFTYDIKFRPTGIAIITGPNGFGKSTILKIIASLVEEGLYEVCQYPFSKLTVFTNNGDILYIEKISNNEIIVNNVKLQFISSHDFDSWERKYSSRNFEQIGINSYIDKRTGNVVDRKEFILLREKYSEENAEIKDRLIAMNYMRARREQKEEGGYKNLDLFYSVFKKDLGEIKFIREQRLLREEKKERKYFGDDETEIVEVIKEIPEKLKEKIQETILQYSQISSKLDSTYPQRLFNMDVKWSQEDYMHRLADIVEKQEKIVNYKLLQDIHVGVSVSQPRYKREFATALEIYLEDTRNKLAVFDELVEKIDLYETIIDKKLFNKHVEFSGDFGLKIVRDDGIDLSLEKLSSGEKQIIVLYYDLIFGLENKLILLIDEPEISLHVAWQREILNDFNKIIDLKKDQLSVIVATHSPQLIDNHWDMVIDLGENNALY